MNEHEFQPTSQFSGTVSFGWNSQKPRTSSRAQTSPTVGLARHARRASFRRENTAALTFFSKGRTGWDFPNETTFMSEELPTPSLLTKCSACQPPTATPFQGQRCLQLLHAETFHLAAYTVHGHPGGANLRPHVTCHPHAILCSHDDWTLGTCCHSQPNLCLSLTPSRPEPCAPVWLLKRLVLEWSCQLFTYYCFFKWNIMILMWGRSILTLEWERWLVQVCHTHPPRLHVTFPPRFSPVFIS